MTYQVLARKWRPQDFPSLIGQQAVVTALTNALREGRVAQAYLFSGIRGVGKTTAARVFAKALNCESVPELRPCSACPTCRDITSGADLDVLEIDAATYSKVEQVRELAESLKYGPARDRYKVVVIDEVHRLSRQAFDALLKLIEEPPPRLVFIFATTEIDAVPATILSRCQEFQFRRVSVREVAAHLAEICRVEGLTASPRALALLARAGEGSVRDSVALLDQLATFGNGQVEEEEAARLLGGLDLALFDRLLGAILGGDAPAVSALAREVEEQGSDPRQVHAHFLAYCRDALHLALGGDGAVLELPDDERATLGRRVTTTSYEDLLRLLHHLLGSEASVRRSDAGALALELAWLRAAELPKLVRLETLLATGALSAPTRPTVATARNPPADAPSSEPPAPAPKPAARAVEAPPAPAPPATPPGPPAPPPRPAPVAPTAVPPLPPPPAAEASVARFFEELSTRRPTLAAQLGVAECSFTDGTFEIAYGAADNLVASALQRATNREVLDAAVAAVFGAAARWRPRARASDGATPAATVSAPAAPGAASAAMLEHPRVQAVLEIFGGSIAGVAADNDDSGEPE
jgi:DNA polymerase-3 subunit gamma/tau